MTSLYFEDVEVGDGCVAGPYLVTKSEIIQFAKQYDPVPENIDEEAAKRSIFGGLTACSPHTFSIYILLTTQLRPRLHFLAGLGWDELRMPNAIRPDDELDLELSSGKTRVEVQIRSGNPSPPNPLAQSKARNGSGVHRHCPHCAATRHERAGRL